MGDDGRVKIRTKLIALSKGQAIVVCGNCGGDVPVDLLEGPELREGLLPKVILRKPPPGNR